VGDLFHFALVASWKSQRKAIPKEAKSVKTVAKVSSSPSKGLAFFSLSADGVAVDSRVDLEHFGLIYSADADRPDDYEPWPLVLM